MKDDDRFDKKVRRRMFNLITLFRDNVSPNFPNAQLNTPILYNVVCSYFYDLNRYKDFHKIKWADPYKRAAFCCKWITKFKPIQISRESLAFPSQLTSTKESLYLLKEAVRQSGANYNKLDLLVNEFFALNAGLANLKHPAELISDSLETDFFRNMLYELRYRNVDGETLVTRFYLIDQLITKQKAS